MKTVVCLVILSLPFLSHAQPGTLDRTFGDTGIVLDKKVLGITNIIALQSDGKIVAGGGYTLNNIDPLLIARYHIDGSQDESFGNNGFTGTTELSEVFGMAIQPDDAIIALGHTASDIKLAKYKKDGGLDSSFGTNGIIITNIGNNDVPSDIALQPDGRIVVGGYIINAENQPRQGFLLRYLPNGILDKSFAGKGIKLLDTLSDPRGFALLSAIALQKDGKILVSAGGDKPFVYRFNSNGSLDRQFGSNGEAFFQFRVDKITGFGANKIAVQNDGKIVGGGTGITFNAQHSYIAAARIAGDGSIDSSFGINGLQYVVFSGEESEGNALLLQADEKVVVSGRTYDQDQTYSYASLTRLTTDGMPDSTFGTEGKSVTDAEGYTTTKSAVLQKDGKIVLGGSSYIGGPFNGASYFFLARYNNNISKKQIIVTKIKRWLQHHGITWQTNNAVRYYHVQRSNDGGITYQPVAKIYNNRQPQYNYEEATVTNNSLYRIAAVWKDGSRTYSNSVLINNEASVSVFPNPVRNNLQVQGLAAAGKTNISITDFSGSVRTSAVASGSTYSINTANLKPGNYLLKVQHDNTLTTQTFVKE